MSIDAMKLALEALEFLALETFVDLNKPFNVGPTRGREAITALRAAIEQAQEPFCYHDGRNIVGKEFADHSDVFPLYTAPRQWQGLTDEEINNSYMFWVVDQQDIIGFGRSIETKLRKKNT